MRPEAEAAILVKYLTGKPPIPSVESRYLEALRKCPVLFTPRERKIWDWCIKHPYAFQFVDAALALTDRYNNIRKNIYLMVCILETTPEYARFFWPRKRSPLDIVYRGVLHTLSTGFKFVIGRVLLWMI